MDKSLLGVARLRRCANPAYACRQGSLPAGLTTDPEAYDAWFRATMREAMMGAGPTVPHQQVMDEAKPCSTRNV